MSDVLLHPPHSRELRWEKTTWFKTRLCGIARHHSYIKKKKARTNNEKHNGKKLDSVLQRSIISPPVFPKNQELPVKGFEE